MMTLSAFSSRDSMTVILEDTLEPPTMATKGFLGLLTAPDSWIGGKVQQSQRGMGSYTNISANYSFTNLSQSGCASLADTQAGLLVGLLRHAS